MRSAIAVLVFLNAATLLLAAAHGEEDLSRRYRFQRTLDDDGGLYVLHWSFDLEAGTIAFAVNVSTTGWVGFGLSPNGQMPLSDVVIGWVDNQGETQFHDRFAERRAEPTIDDSQDWILTASSEQGGRTVLEFNRALVTCDDQYDIDITSDTARVVWSYGANDPAGITGLAQHIKSASISLNLLGGLNEETGDTEGADFFEIRNDNVLIPSNRDTTYWCKVVRLPDFIRNAEEEVYIFRQSPALTPHDRQYVHHMLAFVCPLIQSTDYSGDCDDGAPQDVQLCRNIEVLGSWAVGGEDFIFPSGVAYPIGGQASSQEYILLETHYDNPGLTSDVSDSSGFRFYYSTTAPTHKAGTIILGHNLNRLLIVPPGSSGYTISGVCQPSCTSARLPEGGITVFASLLHTHLLGRAIRVRHYTASDPDCDGLKELEPIDQNLQYDFNFQQTNIIPQRVIKPGDTLELECFYNSSRPGITVGGESTLEEMCFNFLTYYPRIDLSLCISQPTLSSFQTFTDQYLMANQSQEALTNLDDRNLEGIEEDFNSIDWTPSALGDLESALRTGNLTTNCITNFLSQDNLRLEEPNPVVQCRYEPPPRVCTPAPTSMTTSHGNNMAPSALLLAVPLLASRM